MAKAADVGSPEDRFVQLLLAFAQGAHPYLLSAPGIRAARDLYGGKVHSFVDDWHAVLPTAVFYARALGACAAQLAAKEGSKFIDGDHFNEAARLSALDPRIDCPFCR